MGYFSGGCEGADYRVKYCDRCTHDVNEDCPVWLAHIFWNSDEHNKPDSVLHRMIPRTDTGNGECFAFKDCEGGK